VTFSFAPLTANVIAIDRSILSSACARASALSVNLTPSPRSRLSTSNVFRSITGFGSFAAIELTKREARARNLTESAFFIALAAMRIAFGILLLIFGAIFSLLNLAGRVALVTMRAITFSGFAATGSSLIGAVFRHFVFPLLTYAVLPIGQAAWAAGAAAISSAAQTSTQSGAAVLRGLRASASKTVSFGGNPWVWLKSL
jgi:hypothetical protein